MSRQQVNQRSDQGGKKARPATLKQVAAQISENVRALDADEISLAEFDVRQRAAWDQVARGEPNIIGSACSRRHVRVVRYLGLAA